MVRLWLGKVDFGTASEKQANLWLAYHRGNDLDVARVEPVAADAPSFLNPNLPPDVAASRRRIAEADAELQRKIELAETGANEGNAPRRLRA